MSFVLLSMVRCLVWLPTPQRPPQLVRGRRLDDPLPEEVGRCVFPTGAYWGRLGGTAKAVRLGLASLGDYWSVSILVGAT